MMLKDNKLVSNKVIFSVVLLTVILINQDYNNRFNENVYKTEFPLINESVEQINSPILAEDVRYKINGMYRHFRKEVDGIKLQGVTADGAIQKGGTLRAALIDGKVITLKAIIKEKTIENNIHEYALLEIYDKALTSTSIEKLTSTDILFGYELKILENKRLELFKSEASKIILIMYDSSSKTIKQENNGN